MNEEMFGVERAPRAGWTAWRTTVVVMAAIYAFIEWAIHLFDQSGEPSTVRFWAALAAFAAITVAAAPRGFVDRLRTARWRRLERSRGAALWEWDAKWNPRGSRRALWRDLPFGQMMCWTFVLARGAFDDRLGGARVVSQAVFGATISYWAWRWFRAVGAGSVHVWFVRFPYATGDRAQLHFGVSEGGAAISDVEFALVCTAETPMSLDRTERNAVGCVEPAERPPSEVTPGNDVPLVFDVPANAPGTRLAPVAPVYWELVVVGTSRIGEFHERLLVPIYAAG